MDVLIVPVWTPTTLDAGTTGYLPYRKIARSKDRTTGGLAYPRTDQVNQNTEKHRMTLSKMFAAATNGHPSRIDSSVWAVNVENVVKAPHQPVPRSKATSSLVWARTAPRMAVPTTFTVIVPIAIRLG